MFEDILDGWSDLEEAVAQELPEEEEDWDTGNRWDTGQDADTWNTGTTETWQS